MITLPRLDAIIDVALAEDLAGGDLTTDALVESDRGAVGRAIAKADLVACGADVFARVFTRLDPGARVEQFKPDGARATKGEPLWVVEGEARALLMGERIALNFVQRMCGIATLARRYVDAMPEGCPTRITDTRKTTPGLRALERYAVRCGGAHNHRDALGAGVLVKDNHIVAAGGVQAALERATRSVPHTCRIEIEVDSFEMLEEALQAGAPLIMLDNFDAGDVAEAVRRVAGRAMIEVSGQVTLDRVADLCRAGVDVISVGALTHSAPAADISMKLELIG